MKFKKTLNFNNKNQLSKVIIVLFVIIIFIFSINIIKLNKINHNNSNSNNNSKIKDKSSNITINNNLYGVGDDGLSNKIKNSLNNVQIKIIQKEILKQNNNNQNIYRNKIKQKPNNIKIENIIKQANIEISENGGNNIEKKYFNSKYLKELINKQRLKECEYVDLVYTWVNGTDPNHIADKQKALGITVDFEPHRFRDYGGLKYSLRSQLKYAPWIRDVYIVTAQQIPTWFNMEKPGNVKFIFHNQLFANKSHLPTFSSNAIESNFWNLPKEVSNCFLYLNDDIFFKQPVNRTNFYSIYGDPVLHEINEYISSDFPQGESKVDEHIKQFKYTNQRLDKLWNENKARKWPDHGIQVFKKSIWRLMNKYFGEQLSQTSSHKIRSPRFDSPISFVSNQFTKRFEQNYSNAPYNLNVYAGIWNSPNNRLIDQAFETIKNDTIAHTVCLNDGFDYVDDEIANKIISIYEYFLPDKAIHEL